MCMGLNILKNEINIKSKKPFLFNPKNFLTQIPTIQTTEQEWTKKKGTNVGWYQVIQAHDLCQVRGQSLVFLQKYLLPQRKYYLGVFYSNLQYSKI